MIALPSSCEGCPFYQYKDDSVNSFTPDHVVSGSRVFFLAQNPGEDEAAGEELIRRTYKGRGEYRTVEPQPLIGATGLDFNRRFLPLAQLKRSEVSTGNAIRCRPGHALGKEDNFLPSITSTMRLDNPKGKADIVKALRHCKETYLKIPESVEVVVTMGRHAMFQMTGLSRDEDEYHKRQSVLENWRGYALDVDYNSTRPVDVSKYHQLKSGKVVFFTVHLAALNYGENKKYIHATLQDFYKLGRLLRKEWPGEIPKWSNTLPSNWPGYASFDTEYNPERNEELIRWSMCSSTDELYCVEAEESRVIPIEPGSTVLIQNALADIGHLKNIVDISSVKLEDLMLAHSVLWSGEPHSLNYINSLYGTVNRYKHLSDDEPQAYSAYDAYEPMQMWRSYFIPEFKRDRESWRVYKRFRLPLIDIIDKAQRSGAKLDTSLLDDVRLILLERLEGYRKKAQEITGNPSFNLGGSKAMREELYA